MDCYRGTVYLPPHSLSVFPGIIFVLMSRTCFFISFILFLVWFNFVFCFFFGCRLCFLDVVCVVFTVPVSLHSAIVENLLLLCVALSQNFLLIFMFWPNLHSIEVKITTDQFRYVAELVIDLLVFGC